MKLRTTSPNAGRRQAGMIYLTALGIVSVLSGLILALAFNMRTEVTASAERLANRQAQGVELGAEQWVEAQVDAYGDDPVTVTQVPAVALPVGEGYFWILRPLATSDQQFDFGIADESGKLNLNAATATQLMMLSSSLTQSTADAIVDWRSPAGQASDDGAETPDYTSLPDPYVCKNTYYESVEEVLLVRSMTAQILYGYDLNRNGVIDPSEQSEAGLSAVFNTGSDRRGMYPYLTVYSQQPGARGRIARGLINVNTAPEQVLMCLPGLTQSDAANLVSARGGANLANLSWVSKVLTPQKLAGIAGSITSNSQQYSAEILAVSGDGRGFRRVRIVVDCSSTPCRIIYRKDVTALGWPLPESVRQSLRQGHGIPPDFANPQEQPGDNS